MREWHEGDTIIRNGRVLRVLDEGVADPKCPFVFWHTVASCDGAKKKTSPCDGDTVNEYIKIVGSEGCIAIYKGAGPFLRWDNRIACIEKYTLLFAFKADVWYIKNYGTNTVEKAPNYLATIFDRLPTTY